MFDISKINAINRVIKDYFEVNRDQSPVPAKDLMPKFIAAGIFPKDEKNGLPIRDLLRKLDKTGNLHLIPFVIAIRKQKNTNWFFGPNNRPVDIQPVVGKESVVVRTSKTRSLSDEAYVIDLCDEILGEKALRQHRFDFLLGDKDSRGKQSRLPVDAYYPKLQLVIEFREWQHTRPVAHFDKTDKMTVSGVHRGEQRKLYDQRRRDLLPKQGIRLVEISSDLFACDIRGRIKRDPQNDRKAIAAYLGQS